LQLEGLSSCPNRLRFALFWPQGFGGYGANSDGNKQVFLNETLTAISAGLTRDRTVALIGTVPRLFTSPISGQRRQAVSVHQVSVITDS
jgi:hypothetical protein